MSATLRMPLSSAGAAGRMPFDKLPLGLRVRLAVIGVALRERPLQRHVFTRKRRVGTQAVAKA